MITSNCKKQFRQIANFLTVIVFINLKIGATDYYVSNNGDDNNNGTSASAPWQTIDKVNAASLQPGDNVFFEAGGVWRDILQITHSGSPNKYITYSRYGSGKNPVILGSEQAANWTSSGTANVWQSNTGLDNLSDEYYAGRIFFVDNDSVSWGNYVSGIGELTQEFDYTVSGSTYYIYAPADPDNRYEAIEVTQRDWCIRMIENNPENYIIIDGIDFRFGRLAGFDAGYPEVRGATNLVFRNCTIGYIGSRPSGSAYGISAWHSNFLVENCKITDCGRRGISINLYVMDKPAGEEVVIKNVIVRNNVFKRGYHTTSLDLSLQMSNTDRITDVYYYNNIVDDSDFEEVCDGCTSNQVFFQNGDGSFLDNIYVVGNLFIHATARNILFAGGETNYIWNNTIVGHNPNLTIDPFANVSWNSDEGEIYYRNNILYDNLGDNSLQNHGLLIYDYDADFMEKDYNLYYSLYPKTDRNFSAHRVNNTGGMGYWRTTTWDDYRSENTLFEINSPLPTDPLFIDYNNNDFRLIDTSPAIGTGKATPWVIITDPLGIVDTINKCDLNGKMYDELSWDIGAYSLASSTGINPLPVTSDREFKISPNPANKYFTISPDTTVAGSYSFRLFDIQGRLVHSSQTFIDNQPVEISLENIPSGLFFLRFYNEKKYVGTQKLIVFK